MTKIPFTDTSAHVADDWCTARRLQQTLAFIHPEDMGENVLDVGERNYVGTAIAKHFGTWVPYNTDNEADLNWELGTYSSDIYETVLCLEVLEHTMNPAMLLENIRGVLPKSRPLYLSTPLHNRCGFFFNESCHFAEYKESSIRTLLEYSGFKITDVNKFKSIPFWQNYLHGGGLMRGTLRALTQETILIRAVKA